MQRSNPHCREIKILTSSLMNRWMLLCECATLTWEPWSLTDPAHEGACVDRWPGGHHRAVAKKCNTFFIAAFEESRLWQGGGPVTQPLIPVLDWL